MMRRRAQWQLLWAILLVALLGALSTGLVSAAQRRSRVLKPKAAPAARPSLPVVTVPAKPAAPVVAATGVQVTFPESDAKVRGVVPVKVAWSDEQGYVIFRVDGAFVYASTSPYVMNWDTSNLSDGPHVVSVDAFDSAAKYQGSSSIRLEVANALPMPDTGVVLSLQFGPEDVLSREVKAKGELSSLAADQMLPAGYDVLAGSFQARITQSVQDPFYRGTAVLVRNQLKEAWLTVVSTRTSLPAEHAMVEISRNGLTIPESSTVRRTRLPWGEISLALPEYPVFPGDTWEAPIGTVVDLYTKRTIYVSAQHTFEGLRWYGGRECATISSEYKVPEETLFEAQKGETPTATSAAASEYVLQLTGMMGGMMGGGMRGGGARGGMRGGARGMQGGARGGARGGRAPGGATGGRAGGGAAETLLRARLVRLEGKRTTYLTLKTGRVLHTEDAVRGQLEFQTAGGQSRAAAPSYRVQLTGMMGAGMRGGGARGGMRGGMRGGGMGAGMRGGGMRGGGMRGGARAGQGRAGTRAGAAPQPIARHIPSNVGYTFRLTTDLVTTR